MFPCYKSKRSAFGHGAGIFLAVDLGSRLWNRGLCQGLWFWTVPGHMEECWNHRKPFSSPAQTALALRFPPDHMKAKRQR